VRGRPLNLVAPIQQGQIADMRVDGGASMMPCRFCFAAAGGFMEKETDARSLAALAGARTACRAEPNHFGRPAHDAAVRRPGPPCVGVIPNPVLGPCCCCTALHGLRFQYCQAKQFMWFCLKEKLPLHAPRSGSWKAAVCSGQEPCKISTENANCLSIR
jgi:hypothetical protein